MNDEIAALVGAVAREVRDGERDGEPVRTVVAARIYDTNIEDLWDALTNADRIPRWFAPISGDLKLGGRYQIQGNAGGTITRCEPPRELAATWEFGGGMSWLEISLRPEGADRARLELRHIAPVDPHWEKYGPGAVGVGWDLGLFGLVRHLQNPDAARPPEGDPSWMATPEAKSFMTLSSADWGRADIANGEAEATARNAAELTRKFYCGEA
ncbi:Aha1 domain protein [alpha proteobacterium U9-1i]|nr:Aha1 domain protein [alpha proteobacterium U9-1i]